MYAWQWEICLLIIIGIMMTLLVFVVLSWIFLPSIWAFNITQRMEKDEILVNMCIKYNLSGGVCDKLYGGIPENTKGNPGNVSNNYTIHSNNNNNVTGY